MRWRALDCLMKKKKTSTVNSWVQHNKTNKPNKTMGVTKLMKEMLNKVTNAGRIDLRAEAARRSTPLLLACDKNSFIFWLNDRGCLKTKQQAPDCIQNLTFGGQYQELAERTEWVLNCLKSANIELVIVSDGPRPYFKNAAGFDGRTAPYEPSKGLWDALLTNPLGSFTSAVVPSHSTLQTMTCDSVFEKMQLKQIKLFREADPVVVAVAKQNDCFAVLSNDSDFFVMEDAPRFIPLNKLEIPSTDPNGPILAHVFSKQDVARLLGLRDVKLLPAFGALVGNDITKDSGFLKMITGGVTTGSGLMEKV